MKKEIIATVISLIEDGYPLHEIQQQLHLTNSELNKVLKIIRDTGYNYYKTFSSDGEIIIKLNKTLSFGEKKSVRINVKERTLKAIFISDLHIGSIYERPRLLKMVCQYAEEHDCHLIINGGDEIENIYTDAPNPPKIPTVKGQVDHFIRIHPYIPLTIYLNLYGNHDYKSLQENAFDIARYIEDRRYDMPSLGYGECIIHLKDDAIAIVHNISKSSRNVVPDNVSAVYRGHSHKSKTRDNKIIYIPSLSECDTSAYEYRPLAGFLDAEFIFFDKKIARINMKQLAIIKNEIRLANEETMILQPDYQERPRTLEKRKEKGKK